MRALSLVTNDDAQFYQAQVEQLERRGVEVTTLAVPGDNHSESMNPDEDGSRSVLDYARFYPTVLSHSRDDYDLLHANYGLTAPMAVAQPSLPVVLSLWGSDLMGTYGPVTRRLAPYCDEVVVMSEDMAEAYGDDCWVIPHGVDTEKFRPIGRDRARKEIGWETDDRVVLFPYPAKREVKDYPRARRIVDRAREQAESPVAFRTATEIPHDRMPYYLNAADAMILSSKREGSPNTVKEAMACNLPVVSTDVGDVRDRLAPVEPATVSSDNAELAAGLAEILDAGVRSNGRTHTDDIGLDQMGAQLLDVYEAVTSRNSAIPSTRTQ